MAIGAALATVLAASAALTLVPALLRLLGARIDRFQLRPAARAAERGGLWRQLSRFVLRRRISITVVCFGLLLALSVPAIGLQTDVRSTSILPRHDAVRRANERVAASFGAGAAAPVQVLTRGVSPAALAPLLRHDRDVRTTLRPSVGRGHWIEMDAVLRVPPDTVAAERAVRRLREAI